MSIAGASLEQKLPFDGMNVCDTVAKGTPSPHEQILLNASPAGGAIRVGDSNIAHGND